jgi:hypothetical protein
MSCEGGGRRRIADESLTNIAWLTSKALDEYAYMVMCDVENVMQTLINRLR